MYILVAVNLNAVLREDGWWVEMTSKTDKQKIKKMTLQEARSVKTKYNFGTVIKPISE